MTQDDTPPPYRTDPSLHAENVRHGFFGRRGGLSSDLYASLNCGPGSDDAPAHIAGNRARVATALGAAPEDLLTLYQVHSAEVVTVTEAWTADDRPKADAMVSAVPGLALGILTADCCPVLYADTEAGVVGAAHAGWKGALQGIAGATVDAMIALGARRERIRAVLGPTIRQAAYEVGPEFPGPFIARDPRTEQYFEPGKRQGHWQFDLAGYVRAELAKSGIGSVSDIGICTYADAEHYFSFRRTTHRGEPDYGRHISVIVLTPSGPAGDR